MLLNKKRWLLLSISLLLDSKIVEAKYRRAEVHMAPIDKVNTDISITKDKKQLAFERRQEYDKQNFQDFLKEQAAEEAFLYGDDRYKVHNTGGTVRRKRDDENTGENGDEEGSQQQEEGEQKDDRNNEEETGANSDGQKSDSKRKDDTEYNDYIMGLVSLLFVTLITIGLWHFYKHFLDSSNQETKSLIHCQVIEAAANTAPQQPDQKQSMGRSYEHLKSEYIKRKQQNIKGKQQSPPTTPSTGVSTRYGTQTDTTNKANVPNTYDPELECGERTAEFVFPTRHFVTQKDVEIQEQDLQ